MTVEIPRYFHAVLGRYVYRIYVTPIDALFVQLGKRVDMNAYLGGGLAGAAAEIERQQQYEQELRDEGEILNRRGLQGIRVFIKANDRGFIVGPGELDELRIDYVGKWRRLIFCKPSPVLILRHATLGKMTFHFRQRKDVIIGTYELERLFGDELTNALDLKEYKKALKKYEKIRNS